VSYKEQINLTHLPQHLAIIMDGNGRWAKQQGKNRIFGHHKGVDAVRTTAETCANLGIPYLTLYAFSTENWGRPSFEVNALMELLVHTIKKEIATLHKNQIRLQAIGNLQMLPPKCLRELNVGIEQTKNNQRLTLTLALSYSSRWEITQMVKNISHLVQQGKLNPDDITEQVITQHLCTNQLPDPELLIRTSGEQRISNFLLWQIAYSELYFTDIFWPQFDQEQLYKAIYHFQQRDRRFGKINPDDTHTSGQ